MMSTGIWSSLSSIIGTLMALAVEVGLLIIALTIVKPRRPDAAMPFVLGAVVHVVATLMWPFFTTVIGVVGGSAGVGGISAMYAAAGLFGTLIRTVGWVLVLFGIVKLANPPGAGPGDPMRFT